MPKLLFLGCNHDQVPYLEVLRSWNYTIVGTDLNQEAPGRDLCSRFYTIGYDETDKLIAMGESENFSAEDKVFTASAQFAHLGAARFAEHFGIVYPPAKSVALCLDKSAYYEYFRESGIPLPETVYLETEEDLRKYFANSGLEGRYYLKSDYSKNPNYVYNFSAEDIPWDKIFWGRDRYLRSKYILQKEFEGISLRINVFGNQFNVFDFRSGGKVRIYDKSLIDLNVIETLRMLMFSLGMENWLLKFDVILGESDYAVLDIGLDPPYRMVHASLDASINFMEYYLKQYLLGQVNYPTIQGA